jgi:hypothetical protein
MALRSLVAVPCATVLLLAAAGCGGSKSPRDQAEQAVRTFLSATEHSQWTAVCNTMTPREQAEVVSEAKQELSAENVANCPAAFADAAKNSRLSAAARRQLADRELKTLRFRSTQGTGAGARLTFSFAVGASGQDATDTVTLVQQRGGWKIASGGA